MKKFLIAILILIPAIVVLALTATAQVLKLTLIIEAQDIIIKDSSNNDFDLSQTYVLDLIGRDSIDIMVFVVPAISYNLNVVFSISEDSEGDVIVTRKDNTFIYNISPSKAGFCDLIIIAENNIEVRKTIHFYIKTDVLSYEDTNIIALNSSNSSLGGEVIDLSTPYHLSEETKLFLDCYPVESIGDNFVIWESSDNNILIIDNNGFAYPNGLGEAKIYATINDKAGNTHIFSFDVNTNNAKVKLNNLYLSYDIDVTDYLNNNIILVSGYYTVKSNSDDTYYVKNHEGNTVDTITVNKVHPNEIGLKNNDYLSKIYLDNGGYHLNINYLDYNSAQDIAGLTYLSSNTAIILVTEDGKLIPKSKGEASVTVFLNNIELMVIDIIVSARATTFRLTKNNEDNKVGIKQEYVWALNWLARDENGDSILDKDYSISDLRERLASRVIRTYDELKYLDNSALYVSLDGTRNFYINNLDMYWSVSNPDYAKVDHNGNLEFFEAVCGNEVTVSATELLHGIKTRLTRRYTFKFIEDKTAVNVYNINDLRGANEGYSLATVMHESMLFDFENPAKTPYVFREFEDLTIRNSIYGNGKMLISPKSKDGNSLLYVRIQAKYIDYNNFEYQPIIFENLEFNGWSSTDKSYSEADGSEILQNLLNISYYHWRGNHLYFDFENRVWNTESEAMRLERLEKVPIEINYCYIHSAIKGITLYEASNIKVTGTIFSNIFASAINIEQQFSHLSTLIIDRVVVRDSYAAGISSILADDNNKFTSRANTQTKIIIRGFYDAYTWTDPDDVGALSAVIPKESLDVVSNIINVDQLYNALGTALKEILSQILYENDLILEYKGKRYSHLGIISMGLWTDVDPDRIIDETGEFIKIPFNLDPNLQIKTSILPISIPISAIESLLDDFESLQRTSIVLSYNFKDGTPKILPDTRCPSNQELYNRLQGKV